MSACPGGAIGSVAVRATWLRVTDEYGFKAQPGRIICQVIAAYALRLNCDRWIILGFRGAQSLVPA